MASKDVRTRGLRLIGTFALVGPVVGTAVVIGLGTLALMWDRGGGGVSFVSMITGALLFGVLALGFGLMLGVLPATLTGLLCLAVSRQASSTRVWLVLSGLIGGVVTFAFTAFLYEANALSGHSLMETLTLSIVFAVVGAIAALACAAICNKWRPRSCA